MTDDERRSRLVVVSEEDCWSLLAQSRVGRVALNVAEGPLIIPVNYILDGRDVVFRTAEGGLLGTAADWGRTVAFEADRLDEDMQQGWSVLVRGELRRVGEEDADRLAGMVTPWAGGDRPVVGRIVPTAVSGRQIIRD